MSHLRSVSLDATTYEIASQLNNFSQFVRTALLLHAGDEDSFHTMDEVKRKNGGYRIHFPDLILFDQSQEKYVAHNVWLDTHRCDPFHPKGQCPACYPVSEGPIEVQLKHLKDDLIKEFIRSQGGEEE
jgi:hypothetical protein